MRSILIIPIICYCHLVAQVNIDTLTYKKEGEVVAWKSGKAIAHGGPTWKLKFKVETGLNLIYRKNGSLYFRGSYVQNEASSLIKNGEFVYYYENGQLRDSGFYENDQRIGVWTHFDQNGDLVYEQDYSTLIRTYFNSNKDTLAFGKMKLQEEKGNYEFCDLTEHEGYWEFRNPEGRCDCKGKLVSSLKHGKWIYYSVDKDQLVETKKKYPKYSANYNYDFLDLCKWK